MVLPLVPLVLIAAGAATGTTGVAAGGRGAYKLTRARKEAGEATEAYNRDYAHAEQRAEATNTRLRAHGEAQGAALHAVVDRMAEFIRRNERQVNETLKLLVDGVEVDINQVGAGGGLRAEALSLLTAVAGAGATGAGAAAGATGLVATVGVASTGTAISSLSGIAAQNAMLAWFGGGSLAAGGGGVALGATALNFVTAGPALFVGGLALNTQGEKALTKARKYAADAAVAARELQAMDTKFHAIDQRLDELQDILSALVSRASRALDDLEGLDFDGVIHADLFQKAMALTVAVRDVATTPPVDDDGDLSDKAARVTLKYREYLT